MRLKALSISGSRKPTKLDRIRAFYIEGKKLNEKEEFLRQRYQLAHSKLCVGYSREQTVQLLMDEIKYSRAQCYTIVREAIELLGDITKSNKEGKRYIISENFMRAAQKAMEKGDIDNWLRALEDYAKINGLYDFNGSTFDPLAMQLPQTIIFAADPKILVQNNVIHNGAGAEE